MASTTLKKFPLGERRKSWSSGILDPLLIVWMEVESCCRNFQAKKFDDLADIDDAIIRQRVKKIRTVGIKLNESDSEQRNDILGDMKDILSRAKVKVCPWNTTTREPDCSDGKKRDEEAIRQQSFTSYEEKKYTYNRLHNFLTFLRIVSPHLVFRSTIFSCSKF